MRNRDGTFHLDGGQQFSALDTHWLELTQETLLHRVQVLQLRKGPAQEVPLKWSPKLHAAEMRKRKDDKRAPKNTMVKGRGAVAVMRRPAAKR